MHLADNEFFEQYKRLDKLCSEMYGCQKGVGEYISEMENKGYQGKLRISSWETDYRLLYRARRVRNQIAHGTEEYQISDPEDLAFVKDFYDRIFTSQDPLTLLRKSIEESERRQQELKRRQTQPQSQPPVRYPSRPLPKRKSNKWIGFAVAAGILALVILFYCFNR